MTWHPDRLWHKHPAVTKGVERTAGQRAADAMKAVLATWGALGVVLLVIAVWIAVNPSFDRYPYILLNLCLSCFAALQCFVLLIANKRGEQIAAEVAQHTYENTCSLQTLLAENVKLTEQVRVLSQAVRDHVLADQPS